MSWVPCLSSRVVVLSMFLAILLPGGASAQYDCTQSRDHYCVLCISSPPYAGFCRFWGVTQGYCVCDDYGAAGCIAYQVCRWRMLDSGPGVTSEPSASTVSPASREVPVCYQPLEKVPLPEPADPARSPGAETNEVECGSSE